MNGTDRLVAFILERENIRVRKERGDPWPWTDDPILRAYRFCNVRRNDDRQTRLIHTNWLAPHKEDPDLWFACVVARLVNWWPTLAGVGYPVPWEPAAFIEALQDRKLRGEKVYTGAYMVRADAMITGGKETYHAHHVLTPMWIRREELRPRDEDTLATFHARLMTTCRDMGSFMAAQVVADAKFFDDALLSAEDWTWWAAPGPGSLRGLSRVLGFVGVASALREDEWRANFALLWPRVNAILKPRIGVLTGQDLQNCLCEFDKYERVRLGEGRPRSKYQPPKEQEA